MDEGVSPVVGVVLMIAVTVGLFGVVLTWYDLGSVDFKDVEIKAEVIQADTIKTTYTRAQGIPGELPGGSTLQIEHRGSVEVLYVEGWNIGEPLRLPCMGEGSHRLTLDDGEQVLSMVTIHCYQAEEQGQEDGWGDDSESCRWKLTSEDGLDRVMCR